MGEGYQYVTVGVCALFDPWAAVPPALTLSVDPLRAAGVIGLSSLVSLLVTILVSAKARTAFAARFGRGTVFGNRTERFMARWGTPGLGLLSPLVLGPVLTTAAAIALGARPAQLASYGAAGTVL